MAHSHPPAPSSTDEPEASDDSGNPACIMVFNANDPSGAAGLSGDVLAISSAGAHAVPVVTGAYSRDSAEIFDHFALDEDAVAEQARTILEDMPVRAIKVGFVGNPENLSTIAGIASDYADVPVIAYMPNLSWWDEAYIDAYLDAFRELLLPQTTVLAGNHNTLWRWLLPDWSSERPPTARDIARAAAECGVPYTLVTGIALPDQFFDNTLASPQSVLMTQRFERFDAVFAGAGETLAAALAALVGSGMDLVAATREALAYLDRSLDAGFQPGMGHVLPDRLFWAGGSAEDDGSDDTDEAARRPSEESRREGFELPDHDTQH